MYQTWNKPSTLRRRLFYIKRAILRLPEWRPDKWLYSTGILSGKTLCLPDFLGIGTQKAGTTWLRLNLLAHPEVFCSTVRTGGQWELHYFNNNFCKSLRFYSRFFEPGRDKVKGDITPNYCIIPRGRIRFIRRIMPDVKLIFLMRNPIDRA